MAKSEKAEEPKADVSAEPMTLDELARATGNIVAINPLAAVLSGETREPYTGRHLAAAQLHGWAHHATATAEPLTLKLGDYLKALDAADGPPKGARVCVPHAGACSPFSPHDPAKLAAQAAEQIAQSNRKG